MKILKLTNGWDVFAVGFFVTKIVFVVVDHLNKESAVKLLELPNRVFGQEWAGCKDHGELLVGKCLSS